VPFSWENLSRVIQFYHSDWSKLSSWRQPDLFLASPLC